MTSLPANLIGPCDHDGCTLVLSNLQSTVNDVSLVQLHPHIKDPLPYTNTSLQVHRYTYLFWVLELHLSPLDGVGRLKDTGLHGTVAKSHKPKASALPCAKVLLYLNKAQEFFEH